MNEEPSQQQQQKFIVEIPSKDGLRFRKGVSVKDEYNRAITVSDLHYEVEQLKTDLNESMRDILEKKNEYVDEKDAGMYEPMVKVYTLLEKPLVKIWDHYFPMLIDLISYSNGVLENHEDGLEDEYLKKNIEDYIQYQCECSRIGKLASEMSESALQHQSLLKLEDNNIVFLLEEEGSDPHQKSYQMAKAMMNQLAIIRKKLKDIENDCAFEEMQFGIEKFRVLQRFLARLFQERTINCRKLEERAKQIHQSSYEKMIRFINASDSKKKSAEKQLTGEYERKVQEFQQIIQNLNFIPDMDEFLSRIDSIENLGRVAKIDEKVNLFCHMIGDFKRVLEKEMIHRTVGVKRNGSRNSDDVIQAVRKLEQEKLKYDGMFRIFDNLKKDYQDEWGSGNPDSKRLEELLERKNKMVKILQSSHKSLIAMKKEVDSKMKMEEKELSEKQTLFLQKVGNIFLKFDNPWLRLLKQYEEDYSNIVQECEKNRQVYRMKLTETVKSEKEKVELRFQKKYLQYVQSILEEVMQMKQTVEQKNKEESDAIIARGKSLMNQLSNWVELQNTTAKENQYFKDFLEFLHLQDNALHLSSIHDLCAKLNEFDQTKLDFQSFIDNNESSSTIASESEPLINS